jgi:hypothetical protein
VAAVNTTAQEETMMVGMRVHANGMEEVVPWRFRSLDDLRSAFYELEGEDPSVERYTVVAPDPDKPVWPPKTGVRR